MRESAHGVPNCISSRTCSVTCQLGQPTQPRPPASSPSSETLAQGLREPTVIGVCTSPVMFHSNVAGGIRHNRTEDCWACCAACKMTMLCCCRWSPVAFSRIQRNNRGLCPLAPAASGGEDKAPLAQPHRGEKGPAQQQCEWGQLAMLAFTITLVQHVHTMLAHGATQSQFSPSDAGARPPTRQRKETNQVSSARGSCGLGHLFT